MATEKEIKYLKDNFDYWGFINLGFYDKSIKPDDYDSQIKKICDWFSIEVIFQYDIVMINTKKMIKADLNIFSEN